ncbi:universal stress protein [Amnibacterium kyonggiense]|nr:universal stress protein [Amnibacterium kyonggiense]
MSNTIAVGIAQPTDSRDALEWAMRRAIRSSAEVVLIHVADPRDATATPGPWAPSLAQELHRAEAMEPDSQVRVRALRGSVMWQLVAASDDFDLVVVGTHKTGFIHGSIFGSTTLALAASSACPVVVVPAPTIADPLGVVVGGDGSLAGRAALEFAADEAAATGQPLVIVRADPIDGPTGPVDPLLGVLGAAARARHPGIDMREHSRHGPVAEVLIAASGGAQLLVLGDSRTDSSTPPALGAVCHDALVNIRVPTAIVHAADSTATDGGRRKEAWLRSARAANAGAKGSSSGSADRTGPSALSVVVARPDHEDGDRTARTRPHRVRPGAEQRRSRALDHRRGRGWAMGYDPNVSLIPCRHPATLLPRRYRIACR